MNLLQQIGNAVRAHPARLVSCTLALGMVAGPATASFNGGFELGFGTMFIGGLVVSAPGGFACLLAEWIGSRRRPPRWAGVIALVLGLLCLWRVLASGPADNERNLLFAVPPLMSVALVTLLPAPAWRLVAVWAMSLGTLWLILQFQHRPGPASRTDGLLGGLLGGMVTHLLLWHLGFLIGQLRRRRAGITAPPGPDWQLLRDRTARGLKSAIADLPPLSARGGAYPGLYWWLGGTAVFYLAILALSLTGWDSLLQSALITEWRLAELLGLSLNYHRAATPVGLWLTHGLVWSAIAGAGAWGAAAAAGRFDAGRLAPLRLAAIVLAACMLLWLAQPASIIRY